MARFRHLPRSLLIQHYTRASISNSSSDICFISLFMCGMIVVMQSIEFGNTGESLSKACLGTMQFGGTTDEKTACEILDGFVHEGGSFIDTANIYSFGRPNCVGGESEQILGRWLRSRGSRADLFLATKVGMEYPGCAKGLRAEQIIGECDKSLKRLGVETIDFYYAHADDRSTPLEESLEAFDRLVESGKVRFIGASNYRTWRLAEALGVSRRNGWSEFCCIQQRYSYLRPRPGAVFDPQVATTDELLDMSMATNFPIIGYAPLLKGVLAGRSDKRLWPQYDWPDSHDRLSVLRSVAEEIGASPAQVAIAWMLTGRAPVIPLIAAGSIGQLNENLGGVSLELDPSHVERLNTAGISPPLV